MVYHERMVINIFLTIENRKARHDFEILETFEAGMALMGSEVKSLRGGKANLQDAHIRIKDGEAWLIGAHVALYNQGGTYGHDDPGRSRKLLLKKAEIERLGGRMAKDGLTIVPLKIYFTRGYAKLLLGLARGKKKHDKREDLRKRDSLREMQRLAKGGKVRG